MASVASSGLLLDGAKRFSVPGPLIKKNVTILQVDGKKNTNELLVDHDKKIRMKRMKAMNS